MAGRAALSGEGCPATGRLSFETPPSAAPQDEAELAQILFRTLRSARKRASRRVKAPLAGAIGGVARR